MKVRAKFPKGKFGFYGSERRYDGDVFEIESKLFSDKWMVKLDDDQPKRGRKPKDEQAAVTEDGGE